jgi:SAM-dependent methyltransferase
MSKQQATDSQPTEEWAGEMGERWLTHLDQFEAMIAPVGLALLKHAGYRSGERVIDIGCGGGGTTIDIARQVGPGGSVVGVDISPQLITAAERRARAEGARNVSFRCADATVVTIDGPPFDRLFSRFGLMFFQDAHAAFANLHRLIRAGGRADFSVWPPGREIPWVSQVMGIIGRYVQLPAPTPRAPGPFALDDPDYIRELLDSGGFSGIRIDTWNGEQPIGGSGASPEQATAFVLDAMSLGKAFEEEGAAPHARMEAEAELRALFARNHDKDGIRMPARAYLVSAIA